MAFADHYPLESFRQIADAAWWRGNDFSLRKEGVELDRAAYDRAIAADAADRKRLMEHKEFFQSALLEHLTDLRADGRMGIASGLGGRDIAIAEIWNQFARGENAGYPIGWLLNALECVWTRCFVQMDKDRSVRKREDGYIAGTHEVPSDDQIQAAWEKICSEYDIGTSIDEEEPWAKWEIEANDQVSGDRCQLHFVGWQAIVMKYDEKYNLVPIGDIETLGIVSTDLHMPTGIMMLTDALRIESFIEGTEFDSAREYGSLSLNNAYGRNNRMLAHAAEHEVGYTQTSNTYVTVWQDTEGRVMVTDRYNYEGDEIQPQGWTHAGEFSCDVWAVLAFDREIAIARMTEGGSESAAAELDRYLSKANAQNTGDDDGYESCYAGNIVTLNVKPGIWKMHGGENYNDLVDRDAMRLPKDIHIWCLFEPVS